jgi:hypothetical protein
LRTHSSSTGGPCFASKVAITSTAKPDVNADDRPVRLTADADGPLRGSRGPFHSRW